MVRQESESPTQAVEDAAKACVDTDHANLPTLTFRLGTVSPTSHDLPRLNPTTAGSSDLPVDVKEMEQALDALLELAAMDSLEYPTKLSAGVGQTSNRSGCALHAHPKLSKLNQSIHRFHSLIRNLTYENDQQTMQLLDLQRTVDESQDRQAKLEQAVTKLHRRNQTLKKQSKSHRTMAKNLFQQVKDYTQRAVQRKKEEDFGALVTQLQRHEQLMTSNRERTDSNMSELDGLEDFVGSAPAQDSTSVASSDGDNRSTHSNIYEDGVATVKFSRQRTRTWPHSDDMSGLAHDEESKSDSVIPSIVGAQSPSKKVDVKDTTKNHGTASSNNPFAMFLGGGARTAQPYTLSFVKPFQLQFVELPKGEDSDGARVFAVSGYAGFDGSTNVKPTVGARLLQVNKHNLDPSWSSEELEEHIGQLGERASMTFRNDAWNKEQKHALDEATDEQAKLHPEANTTSALDVLGGTAFMRRRTQSNEGQGKNMLSFWNF
eukprot:Nitzschia sp. Nitz4//scaffold15_size197535//180271//181737//NITZ4_001609-RA/size197535-processed-gene-0.101-mRNA-1//-1//CDS//3329537808//8279//frame0